MDKLAKQQACQLWIEQEVEKGLAAGEKKATIGKRIAAELLNYFGAVVKPHTIAERARELEIKSRHQENWQKPASHGDHLEKEENQDSIPSHGGAREGAGRLPKVGPSRIGMQFARIAIMKLEQIRSDDAEFEEALNCVLEWIQKRKGEIK